MFSKPVEYFLNFEKQLLIQEGWLPRNGKFTVRTKGCQSEKAWIVITFHSGPDTIYDYYPFSVWIYSSGKCVEILEFNAPFQSREVWVRYPKHATFLAMETVSELSCIPIKAGINDDKRELSIRVHQMAVREKEDSPECILGLKANRFLPVKSAPYPPGNKAVVPPVFQFGAYADLQQKEGEQIFIVGSYRSMTSALTWSLGQHPDLFGMEETNWMIPLSAGIFSAASIAKRADRSPFDVYKLSDDLFFSFFSRAINDMYKTLNEGRIFDTFLSRLSGKAKKFDSRVQTIRSKANPKRGWVDGTPENSGYIQLLERIFPNSKFIFLVRDPREVVRSLQYMHSSTSEQYDSDSAFQKWEEMNRVCIEAALGLPPHRFCMVRCVDLVSNPEKILRDIFHFVNLPFFAASTEVFSIKLNSSFKAGEEASVELPESKRHETIYEGLTSGENVLGLPWSKTLDLKKERVNDLLARNLGLFIG